ncbi:MAG: cytochrome oxidase [Desulfobacterales bacterium GWB2_56_26]|nr:MAG: cytochrome oxidase [Desulfobacterales bacterium GWB2_56_26]
MELFQDQVLLSRIHFAFTAIFHILFPVLTIGLSIFLVGVEAKWLLTGQERYYQHARFWMRLFLLNFAVGVVSGIPMEFQFGTNWSAFSRAGGDIFGHLLGFEASMAFMLEAAFLGIMAFGWKRVSPGMHFFATCMVAFGGSLSAFWIMAANSWMQTPVGGEFVGNRFILTDAFAAIWNPDAFWGITHMWLACLEISLFVIGGISAWYLLRGRDTEFFLVSFKAMVVAAIVVTLLQMATGDGAGKSIFKAQPAKLAGIEAHWQTNPEGEGAPWKILAWPDKQLQANVWEIEVPNVLSLLATYSKTGTVTGLKEFPVADQPPLLLPFYSFRLMVLIGLLLAGLMVWSLWAWKKGELVPERVGRQKRLLYAWMAAIPLSYLAMETGWIVREVGRQPWVIQGVLRTEEGVSRLPAESVTGSLIGFVAIYTLLLILFLLFARRILQKGPNLVDSPVEKGKSHRDINRFLAKKHITRY